MSPPPLGVTEHSIVNVVGVGRVAEDIDLLALSSSLNKSVYDPATFPALRLKLEKPRVHILLFSTGKVRLTGAKSKEDLRTAVNHLIDLLRSRGVDVVPSPDIKVVNIVATFTLPHKIDLERLLISLPEAVEYEPEQFPGAVVRGFHDACTALLFRTGKGVMMGFTTEAQFNDAVRSLLRVIRTSFKR